MSFRKILAICILIVASLLPSYSSGVEDTIEVTLDPQPTVNISLNQSSWFTSCALGNSEASSSTWASLMNTGDVSVQVNVSATNTTNWSLVNQSNIGHNSFCLQYSSQGDDEIKEYQYYQGGEITSYSDLWQTFNHSGQIVITKVEIYARRLSSAGGYLNLSIRNTSNGLPSTHVLSSVLIPFNNLPSSYNWEPFVFDNPPVINANERYAIYVMENSSQTFRWRICDSGAYDRYPNGRCSEYSNRDCRFRVYGYTLGWEDIDVSAVSFIDSLSPANSHAFGMKVWMPETSSTVTQQQSIITFSAIAL